MPFPQRVFVFSLLFASAALGAQEKPGTEPAAFVRANERFGIALLSAAHRETPDKNVAVAPLPVSISFAALAQGSVDSESTREITSAFQWKDTATLGLAGRMILARFAKPKPRPPYHAKAGDSASNLWRLLNSGKSAELWLTGAFLYRGEGSLSQDFIDRVKEDFSLEFKAVGETEAQSKALTRDWDAAVPMPRVKVRNDFWITSFTHLRTSWAGNTFVGAKPDKQTFMLKPGTAEQADFIKSEIFVYRHARTDDFEAVALPCGQAYIVLLLPTEGIGIQQFERALAKNPEMIELHMERQIGDVVLPPFHFLYETNLGGTLRSLGVTKIFENPSTLYTMAPNREGGRLEGVAQKIEITVDENGIRADAGTIVHGVYGGILGTRVEPFHMILNRPFVFLIRDNVTDALLFAGAVMDPLQH